MNKYLHIILSFSLLVSVVLDLSAKNLPEKGEPTKPGKNHRAFWKKYIN
jgi:hypothetical protein